MSAEEFYPSHQQCTNRPIWTDNGGKSGIAPGLVGFIVQWRNQMTKLNIVISLVINCVLRDALGVSAHGKSLRMDGLPVEI